MLTKLVRYLGNNVLGLLALFVALGGTAYAVNTVNSTDIVDGQVKSVDVGDGEVKSADVKDESLTTFDVSTFLGQDVVDGTLTGADIGDHSLSGKDISKSEEYFGVTVNTVPAQACKYYDIANVTGAQNEQLVVTPNYETTATNLIYAPEFRSGSDTVSIKICNPTTAAINDGGTSFRILVIDAP